ncbi:MAG: hypothetical protein PHE83_05975 [Opitutaceae bacterium]|nr:hypothetical protein [Opitutaceae bacterium]
MNLPAEHLAAIWGELPIVAELVIFLTVAVIVAIIVWPHYRRLRQRRRWQKFPPPPVREELKAPALLASRVRLPRRTAGSRLPER